MIKAEQQNSSIQRPEPWISSGLNSFTALAQQLVSCHHTYFHLPTRTAPLFWFKAVLGNKISPFWRKPRVCRMMRLILTRFQTHTCSRFCPRLEGGGGTQIWAPVGEMRWLKEQLYFPLCAALWRLWKRGRVDMGIFGFSSWSTGPE